MLRHEGALEPECCHVEPALSVIRRLGDTCRTRDLRAVGHYPKSIASAVASGSIERARVGHFVAPDLHEQAKRAIRVGGRVSCVSAAELLGLRVLNRPATLHIEVAENASRLRRARDGRGRILPTKAGQYLEFHWSSSPSTHGAMPSIVQVLAHVIDCLPPIEALCILDSAREDLPRAAGSPMLTDEEFVQLLDQLSERGRAIASRSTTLSQAIGETLARERLREAGIRARPQVELPGGYFADLLIGDRLVFECEGYSAHGDENAFEYDRERMAFLRGCGFLVLNFSHKQIVDDWEAVLATVQLVMRRGEHLTHSL